MCKYKLNVFHHHRHLNACLFRCCDGNLVGSRDFTEELGPGGYYPVTDLRLGQVDGLVPQLEEDRVLFRGEGAAQGGPSCGSSRGTGAEAAAEAEAAALEFA